MVGLVKGFGRKPCQHEHAPDLLAHGGQHFHFTAGVLMWSLVLDVDHADHLIPRDDRGGKEGLIGVFFQFAEGLEPRILVGFARNREQAPLARDPAGQTLIPPQPQLADGGRVRPVGRTQHQFLAITQIDQAGVALGELHDERHNAVQYILQADVANHEAADLLKQAQLLFDPLEPGFELFGFRHDFIIASGREPSEWRVTGRSPTIIVSENGPMDNPADSQFAAWNTPECPFAIEYSLRVLDDIRLAVMDAFFSLPRGGAEIGGILLGTYDKRQVRIADYAPLDCEHAYGPSFTLSDRDHAKLEELLTIARRSGGSVGPVGWYHSHTRSEVFFSDADIAIHKHFFPEPWQIGLVLKPHTFEPMRAGFFFREAGGKIHGEACYREFKLDPQLAPQAAAAVAGVSPGALPPLPLPARAPLRLEPPVMVMPARTEPAAVPPPVPAPVPAPVEVPLPTFASIGQPAPRRLKWVVVALLAAAASAAGAYQTRSVWLPPAQAALVRFTAKPPAAAPAPRPQPAPPPATLGLSTVDQNGQLHITWNRDSALVRGAASGMLSISEGPQPLVIPLDPAHLQNGSFTYGRESGRVDVSLTVEAANGQGTKEVATFIGAAIERSKAEDAAVLKQRDDLAKQADKLKADLKKQAERTRKLENTVDQMRLEIIRQQRTRMQNMSPDAPKVPGKQ